MAAALDDRVGPGKWRVAVVTTGMESTGCVPCPPDDENFYSCIQTDGEDGRFQQRLGQNLGTIESPLYEFESAPACRLIDSSDPGCFFDPEHNNGLALVGIHGCGYEKGLAPVVSALSTPLIESANRDFLRPGARLGVVIVSDEDDCGQVGDVTENLQGISGNACYYAAHGSGPDGSLQDPTGKPYALTPVSETYDFLRGLKGDRPGAVRFGAIVGLADPTDPATTTIQFADNTANAGVLPACSTPGCQSASGYCEAMPGTRYVALAQMFGLGSDGFVDTICQTDFSDSLTRLATFLAAD
jgi:hypothetical protein